MKKTWGLTLVEVLIATTIASIVGGLLLVIIFNSAGLFYKESSKVGQGVRSNDALTMLRNNIRLAHAVAEGYPPGLSHTYTSSAQQLVLQLPSLDSNGNIIQNTYDYFVFYLDGSFLKLKSFPDAQSQRKVADSVLATTITNLSFQYFDAAGSQVSPVNATKVKTAIFLREKSGSDFEIIVATAEASLRND